MNKTNDDLWLSFEALAKTSPDDDGVRMSADLVRWLLQERQRVQLPIPPVMENVLRNVTQRSDAPSTLN